MFEPATQLNTIKVDEESGCVIMSNTHASTFLSMSPGSHQPIDLELINNLPCRTIGGNN